MMRRCSVSALNMAPSSMRFASNGGKRIEFGGDARELMLNGIERIARAVGVTLGPKGRNVIIRQPNGEPKITKDGVTVARSIEFTNQFEDVGARLIRQVASKTNDVAGDGTTTATILAWSIFAEGYKSVATGANPMDLKRGVDLAVTEILASLQEQRRPVEGIEMLRNVATISANGERPLGELIANAVQAVGIDGFIAVVDGHTPVTTWERHSGWSTESGFIASGLVTDDAALKCRLERPLVFVTEERIDDVHDVLALLDVAAQRKRSILFVTAGMSDAALQTVVLNHRKGPVRCGVVVPRQTAAGAIDSDAFSDVAASCDCKVTALETLRRVTDVSVLLGEAAALDQSMDSSVVTGMADTASRVNVLRGMFERVLTEEGREKLRERIAKLTNTFAVIRVGGRSTVEIGESKDRVIDALNAARNALAEGIVAGGGAALLHATKRLDALLLRDEEMEQDRRTGVLIVRNAARLPIKHIADNAGVEGPVILENVLEFDSTAMGYDAQNDKYTDLFAAGIVDPVKVVSSCVIDAASVAGLMITTEASVCDDVAPRRASDGSDQTNGKA